MAGELENNMMLGGGEQFAPTPPNILVFKLKNIQCVLRSKLFADLLKGKGKKAEMDQKKAMSGTSWLNYPSQLQSPLQVQIGKRLCITYKTSIQGYWQGGALGIEVWVFLSS